MKQHIIENVQTELQDVEGRLSTLIRQLESQADDTESRKALDYVGKAYKDVWNARKQIQPDKHVPATLEPTPPPPEEEEPIWPKKGGKLSPQQKKQLSESGHC